MKKYFNTFLIIAFLLPTFIYGAESFSGIKGLLVSIKSIVRDLIPVTFGLAVIAFFFGIGRFILQAGNPEVKNKNKQIIYWGVIAIAVMASIWGLVGFLQRIFGINNIVGNTQSPSGYGIIGP